MSIRGLPSRPRLENELKHPVVYQSTTLYAADEGPPDLMVVLKKAASRALPSGAAGGVAMGLNILCLMWLRTTVNYQYRYGTGTFSAIGALYKDGGGGLKGITRFYRGLVPALMQGPLSRFGDTAANTGTLVILDSYATTKDLPAVAKTAFCSFSAASWRLFLMPIDTWKTTMQTEGSKGMALLIEKIGKKGPIVLYNGGYGAIIANMVGYFPWFATYNSLEENIPKTYSDGTKLSGPVALARRALLGFCASAVSDTTSNSIRVVKVYKQTHQDPNITYLSAAKEVIAKDGILGLFGRGLGTKLIANGIQGAMFSILWKSIEPLLFPKK